MKKLKIVLKGLEKGLELNSGMMMGNRYPLA